jgi:hypothetical protein
MTRDEVGMKPARGVSHVQANYGEKHQRKICRWPGKCHPSRPPRMPALPKRVVRRAGPSKHSAHEQERNNRYNHHSPRLAPDVGHRIQRHLPALSRRFIASHLGHQSVRRFVTGRRKQKRDVPNESENQKIGSEIRHLVWPFRQLSPSRLEVVTLLCKRLRHLRHVLRVRGKECATGGVSGRLQAWPPRTRRKNRLSPRKP